MANDLNQCNFIGRLGKDPEVRYMPSGDPIANFSIACGWKTKDKEGTEWVNCAAFGKLGEICGEYLKKGSQVFVSGRFTTRKYEKDGQTRYTTSINVDRMQMLGSKEGSAKPEATARPAAKPDSVEDMADDIPF